MMRKKNMFTFSVILVIANLLVLMMGALLWMYLKDLNLNAPERADQLYPMLAMNYMPLCHEAKSE